MSFVQHVQRITLDTGPGAISRKGLKRKKGAPPLYCRQLRILTCGILLEPSLNADVSCIISCLDRPDQQTEKQESESESMKSNAIQLFRRLHFFAQDTEAVTLLGDEPGCFIPIFEQRPHHQPTIRTNPGSLLSNQDHPRFQTAPLSNTPLQI